MSGINDSSQGFRADRQPVAFSLWNGAASFFFVFAAPALCFFGGSTSIVNWGPGILAISLCLLGLVGTKIHLSSQWYFYSVCFLTLLGIQYFRADDSPDRAAATHTAALMFMAIAGYLIGTAADHLRTRYLLIGLSIAVMANFVCSVFQMTHAEWNPVYPRRSADFPSGFFAHYNYSTAFCLVSLGLLFSGATKEQSITRSVCFVGGLCALASIPISLSRGGNFALGALLTFGAIIWIVRSFRKSGSSWILWPAIALAVVLMISVVGYLVPMIGRESGIAGFYQDGGRIGFWDAAIKIAAQHPMSGGGAGCFAWEVYQAMDALGSDPVMVHNEALQFALEFGYPTLIVFAILIAIPLVGLFIGFASGRLSNRVLWIGLGLLGMLLQSNFDFVFHTAPGMFFATLALGMICREIGKPQSGGSDENQLDPIFVQSLQAVRSLCVSYRDGVTQSVDKLVALLGHIPDQDVNRSAFRISYWNKTGNHQELASAIGKLHRLVIQKLEYTPKSIQTGKATTSQHGMRWSVAFLALILAIPCWLNGYQMSRVLADCWTPLYRPENLSLNDRFEGLLQIAENNSGLGLDRTILSLGIECMEQSHTQDEYQQWAVSYSPRILNALPSWRIDPSAALQAAEIVSWSEDVNSTLELYDRAAALQGNNESLFRSYSLKGQYLYELSLSAGANGYKEQQFMYVRQAVESFEKASQQLKTANLSLSRTIATMSKACAEIAGNGT